MVGCFCKLFVLILQNSLGNYIKKHENLASALSTYNESIKTEFLLKEEINIALNAVAFHENESATLRVQYENARRSFNKIEDVHRRAKSDAGSALNDAKNLSEGYTPDDRGFSKFKEKFNSLSRNETTLRDILGKIHYVFIDD